MLVSLATGTSLLGQRSGALDLLWNRVEPLSHFLDGLLKLVGSLGRALSHLLDLGLGLGVHGQTLLSQTSHHSSSHPEFVLFVSVNHLDDSLGRIVSQTGLQTEHSGVTSVSRLVSGQQDLLDLLDAVGQVVESLLINSVCVGSDALSLRGVNNLVESLNYSLGMLSSGNNGLVLDERGHHLVETDCVFSNDSGLAWN
jgi:hypothetical protein